MAKSKPTPPTSPPPPPAGAADTGDDLGDTGLVGAAAEPGNETSDDTAEIVIPTGLAVPPAPVARDHGFGTWLVHTPGHTAARTVQASSAAEAVEQYKALMGITTLPAAAVAERVADTPAE